MARPRFTKFRIFMLSLAAVYLAHVTMPIWWIRPGDDSCTFGPVTNEQYRAMRKAAEWELLYSQFWLPSDLDEREVIIARAIDKVADGSNSLFVNLAAMHAVMRSLNGQHKKSTFTNRNRDGSLEKNAASTGDDPSLYHITSLNPHTYSPIWYIYAYSSWWDRMHPKNLIQLFDTPYDMRIIAQFSTKLLAQGNNSTTHRYVFSNAFRIGSMSPRRFRIKASGPQRTRWRNAPHNGPCPSVPSEAWAREFIEVNEITNVEAGR